MVLLVASSANVIALALTDGDRFSKLRSAPIPTPLTRPSMVRLSAPFRLMSEPSSILPLMVNPALVGYIVILP